MIQSNYQLLYSFVNPMHIRTLYKPQNIEEENNIRKEMGNLFIVYKHDSQHYTKLLQLQDNPNIRLQTLRPLTNHWLDLYNYTQPTLALWSHKQNQWILYNNSKLSLIEN